MADSIMSARTVRVAADAVGAAVSKFLICLVKADGLPDQALDYAERFCRSVPQVAATIKAAMLPRTKGAVEAMTTSDSTYAAPLVQYGIGKEAFLVLQSDSILGQLARYFRAVPFHSKTPREFGEGAGGAWRGEGLPMPLTSTTADALQQEYYEMDTIVVVSRELFRFGVTSEKTLRDIVFGGVARFADAQLLGPAITATTARPASLTSSATVITSSGASASNIVADLSSLIAAITTPGDTLRWVMKPTTYYTISAKLAGVGLAVPPGTLLGIPVVLGSGSPRQITLIDCQSIAYSADEQMTLDVNTTTSLEMRTDPSQDATAGTGAQLVSLFQTGMVAVRAGLAVAWQPAYFNGGSPSQPSGVAYMVTSY
jgi:hypothetical protein